MRILSAGVQVWGQRTGEAEIEAVWYGRVACFTTKRILRIPAGGLFSSLKPHCGLSEPKPV